MKILGRFWLRSGSVISETVERDVIKEEEQAVKEAYEAVGEGLKRVYKTRDLKADLTFGTVTIRTDDISAFSFTVLEEPSSDLSRYYRYLKDALPASNGALPAKLMSFEEFTSTYGKGGLDTNV